MWRRFSGKALSQVAFPLGGIGTGCVSLSGRGTLVDWELWNRPNKGCTLPYTFFALWTKSDGGKPDARVLAGYPQPPFTSGSGACEDEWGFAPRRTQGDGLPCMSGCVFEGAFPFARIHLSDPKVPLDATLEAFNPFIPHDADDSAIPVAILTWTLTNRSKRPVSGTIAGSLQNAMGRNKSLGRNVNSFVSERGLRGILMTSRKFAGNDPARGSMGIFTTRGNTTFRVRWDDVPWHDELREFWTSFARTGAFDCRTGCEPSADGKTHVGSLGVRFRLKPGASVRIPFFIAWHFPNFEKYWPKSCDCGKKPVWRNHYAKRFTDALAVARHVAANLPALERRTREFHDALQGSTLPDCVLDALSSQMSILKTTTCLRLPDGTFYGWEGCHNSAGCCEGTCTHVWNYAQALPYLFPELARSSRIAEYGHSFRRDGTIGFRLQLPLGAKPWDYHAAADGQFGSVMNLYRDWLISGDAGFLKRIWPSVKRALDNAIELWDPRHRGVPEGSQHNTYDIEFVGNSSMIAGMYLGALRAGEEISRHIGDLEAAARYRALFEKGRRRVDGTLFNGEYFVQKLSRKERATARYQYADGCLADQLIGQWLADIAGLGDVFEPRKIESALKSIFRYIWREDFSRHENCQRIYALGKEAGLLLCSWPKGEPPRFPFFYCDEVWCGVEYQVASHMIFRGLVREGLRIVKAVRDRHDGVRRNPWNEVECGNHYARSMASWALLQAFSGFQYSAVDGRLRFAPAVNRRRFRCFFSTGAAWGTFEQNVAAGRADVKIAVAHGNLRLSRLELGGLPSSASFRRVEARLHGRPVTAHLESAQSGGTAAFPRGLEIGSRENLEVRFLKGH